MTEKDLELKKDEEPEKTKGDPEKEKDEKGKEDKPEMVGFIEYYKFADRKDVLLILWAGFNSVIKGLQWPLVMLIFGEMIDDLTGVNDKIPGSKMTLFAWFYVGCGILNTIGGYFSHTCMLLTAERQSNRIRKLYFRAILRQEIGWFDEVSSGELTTRLSNDIEKIKEGMSDKVSLAIQWITSFFTGFIIAFYYEWRLSLVIMATSPLIAISAFAFSKIMESNATKEQQAYASAGSIAEEVFGAMRTVVSFGGEEHEGKRFSDKIKSSTGIAQRTGALNGMSVGFTMFVMFATYGLAFWYGAKLCGELKATPGAVLVAFFNVLIGSFGIGYAAPHMQTMAEGRGAAVVVYKTINRESKINRETEEGKIPRSCSGRVELRGVNFAYPSRSDVRVMDGFDLTLEPGKTHALVGASGCGKSTVVGLIERFYDVMGGNVLLDGVDVRELNLRWLRQQIGLVGQEPVLFATTIEENIRYGREDVTQAEIEEACKKAFAHDFIMNLPDKYQSLCGERGSKLSGGQKQRIAIARALVRNPKILLLDEATSALDTESEGIVQRALDVASEGRTTLIIAHRLSTIVNVDKISAVDKGMIIEEGTHSELLAKEGLYHTLVTYQQQAAANEEKKLASKGAENSSQPSVKKSRYSIPDTPDAPKFMNGEGEEAVSEEMNGEVEIKGGKKKKKKEEMASFREIIRKNNRSENLWIAIGTFGGAVNGATMPIFALLFAEVIDALAVVLNGALETGEPDYTETNKWCLYFLITAIIIGFANFVQINFMNMSGVSFTNRIRQQTFKALLRKNLEFFDQPENSVGALTTRLSSDVNGIKGATGVRIGVLVQNTVSMIAGLAIAFAASWRLALLTLACIPLAAAAGGAEMIQISGTMTQMKKLYEEAGKTAAESIENMRTVASLNLEDVFIARYATAIQEPSRRYKRRSHIIGFFMGLAEGVVFFTFAAVFSYGNYLMQRDLINFSQMMKVFSGIVFSAMTVGETLSMLPDYDKAKACAFRVFKIISDAPPIDAYSTLGSKPDVRGVLGFSNVWFNYPTRPNVPVLQGLSFGVDVGKTIALVGQSGCGKSTSVQLTQRFYDTMGGEVTVDGCDIRQLNVAHLRQQMGLVSQEPVLFDCSIEENIRYGALFRDVTEEEVRKAAADANIHTFITSLPEGYKTRVGEKGTQLSGGQKQRIAIARALVRNPKILLLDEATSALDTESEKVVQEALDKAREGRTCLIIAHRLSTVHTADQICVIQEGRVVEQGTHKKLMTVENGVYRNLHKSAK